MIIFNLEQGNNSFSPNVPFWWKYVSFQTLQICVLNEDKSITAWQKRRHVQRSRNYKHAIYFRMSRVAIEIMVLEIHYIYEKIIILTYHWITKR